MAFLTHFERRIKPRTEKVTSTATIMVMAAAANNNEIVSSKSERAEMSRRLWSCSRRQARFVASNNLVTSSIKALLRAELRVFNIMPSTSFIRSFMASRTRRSEPSARKSWCRATHLAGDLLHRSIHYGAPATASMSVAMRPMR